MDLSQLLAMIPGLMSGPYAVPITLAVVILGPMIVKKFPGLANLLAMFSKPNPANPLAPLIPNQPNQPTPAGPLANFPILNSLLNSILKKPAATVADLPPAFLIGLRDEVSNLIDGKAKQHAAELMQLQGFQPEPAAPVK